MAGEKRRKLIFDLLARDGHESIEALAQAMGVSSMTIRRDLAQLEEHGQIRRTHGGAMAISENLGEISLDYQIRQRQNAQIKRLIAHAAADLVESGDVIFLDAGTTVLAMTEFLAKRESLTIVTHSLPVAEKMSGRPGINVFLLGGLVRHDLMSTIGHQTEDFLSSFRVDKAFIGTGGVDLVRGLTHSNLEEIPLKRTAARIARKAIVLADQSKLGKAGLIYFLTLNEIDLLITDGPDGAIIRACGRQAEAPSNKASLERLGEPVSHA